MRHAPPSGDRSAAVPHRAGHAAGHGPPADDELPPPARRLVLVVVGLGTLISAASGSTVNLALPQLGRELGTPVDLTGWVVSSYLLAATVLMLVAGRASDLLGHRRVYLAGTALFGLASALCGLAGGIGVLIGARVAQGVGSAMVMATGPALLTTAFPARQRGRALGMLATATYTGLTIGPPIGGWVVAAWSWRWVFLVNLPAALLIALLGLAFLPARRGRSPVTFDWPGAATLVVGLPLALLALAQGHRWGWLSWPILASAVGGLVLLVAFVLIERRRRDPLLDLRLFRSRVFTGATLSAVGNYITLFVAIILLPFYLIEALGVGPGRAGMLLSAQPIVMALVASPAGRLSDRIGSRGLATAGLLVLAAGVGGLSTVGADSSILVVMAWLAVMGLGTGIFISPNSSALMGAAPRAQQGVAGGVMAVARNLGMIVGVATATTVFLAAGGRTGQAWTGVELGAFRAALLVAAAVSVLSAAAAALRGKQLAPESGACNTPGR